MNCATIAKGIVAAAKKLGLKIPLVVRLEGNQSARLIQCDIIFKIQIIIIAINFNFCLNTFQVLTLQRQRKY